MGDLATSPNSSIPAGLRKRQAFDASAATKHAAGILHIAPDGDILLVRRTGTPGKDNFVGHWSLPGGGAEDGETPQQAAARENKEEIGQDVDPAKLKIFDQRMTPTGMAFHTFASAAPTKFWPTLNDEHNGAGWFSPGELPHPMHPAVVTSIKEKLGDDPGAARDGLAQWSVAADEASSDDLVEAVDIAMDRAMTRSTASMSTDSPLEIAMDRDSVREKTREGRLIVKRTNISKANVCPYRGEEIPGWEALGLEKDRVYNLLRDPEELQKGAATSNGVQLLIKHTPVTAADPHQDKTVGSLGTDAEFDGEYLTNSLFVNVQEAIDGIETGRMRELSAGYHYKVDMTPGNFRGSAYDGVMRNIVYNHVALVEDGRAGPDVLVADSALKEQDMPKATRFGAMTLSITAAAIAPMLAMDQKIVLPKDLFAPLTTKNFKESRPKLLAGVRLALDGKLRKGLALDGSMEQFGRALDAFNDDMTAGVDEPAPEDKQAMVDKTATVEAPKAITEPGATYDAEPFKSFLREKGMGEDDIMKACDMMPKPMAGDEDDEEAKKKKAEEEAAAKAAAAAKDAEMKDMVSKPAMDAALKAQGEKFTKDIAAVRDNERGIRVAIAEVHPWTGDLPATMAFDTAADVYRHALEMKGVEGAKTLHADALKPILSTLPKNGARAAPGAGESTTIAMDASAVGKAVKMAPGLESISTTL